jgi:SSS family solute:Na+ symporter
MALGCFLFVLAVCKFYRAVGVAKSAVSVPEVYSFMFDGRVRLIMVINVVVVYFILFSTQAPAAASVLAPLLGLGSGEWLTWAVAVVFILIAVMGGMKGIAKMNVVHSVVMYAGMFVVCVKAVISAGGFSALREALPPHFFSVAQPDIWTVLAQGLGTAVSFFAASNVVGAAFSASSLKSANRGILIAGFLVIPFALAPALLGVCARVVLPGIDPRNALFGIANHLSEFHGGLISMAIIAAIWSTGPALLLLICGSLTKDLFKRYICPDATESQQLMFSRTAAVVVGLAATLFGIHAGSILNQMLGAFQIRSVSGIVLVISVFWPKVSRDAAFWSMLAGGVVAAVWHFGGNPFGWQPLWPSAAVCLLILIPVTVFGKARVSPGYQMYRESLKQLNESEDGYSIAKITESPVISKISPTSSSTPRSFMDPP